LEPTDLRSPLGRVYSNYVYDGLHLLEQAIRACETALAPRPKNFRACLEDAVELLHRFDHRKTVFEKQRLAAAESRVRGGRARQAKLEPARRRAARLLLVNAPRGGWDSPAQAARTIEPHLAAFIVRRRMSMTGVRRTIVKWIASHPDVSAAYRRCHRPTAT
jgi:hypothetical protein